MPSQSSSICNQRLRSTDMFTKVNRKHITRSPQALSSPAAVSRACRPSRAMILSGVRFTSSSARHSLCLAMQAAGGSVPYTCKSELAGRFAQPLTQFYDAGCGRAKCQTHMMGHLEI